MRDLGHRVGETAGPDIVNAEYRIVRAKRPAAVDHLLRAALDLGIATLDRVEIELLGVGAGAHAGGCATPKADPHAGAAELDQQRARRQVELGGLVVTNAADAAGDHDRLVIAVASAGDVGFESTEVAHQIRAAELVVERRRAERALDHDRQRTGDPGGEAVIGFACRRPGHIGIALPCSGGLRQAQVRHREAAQPRLGLGTAASGTLVSNLPAGAGGRAGKRRDRCGMVVGLDLEDRVGQLVGSAELHAKRTLRMIRPRIQPARRTAFEHGGIVVVGHHRALRRSAMGVADHAEKRGRLGGAVERPAGVEDLVATVLRVGLREHHQFDIGRIASQFAVGGDQIVDLVVGQRQPHVAIGGCQRIAATAAHRNRAHRLALEGAEQDSRIGVCLQHRFRHPVVQQRRHRLAGSDRKVARATEKPGFKSDEVPATTLDARDTAEAAVAGDVGRLACPWRDRPKARNDVERL